MNNPLTTFWQDPDLLASVGGPLPDAPSLSDDPWQIVLQCCDADGHLLEQKVETRDSRKDAKQFARDFNIKHAGGDWVATIEPYVEHSPVTADAPQAA